MASKQGGPGCLILFGLVFVLAGSIPGCIALHALNTARATRGWIETPATLLSVELRRGDDTAAVEARYRYRAPDPQALEPGTLTDYEGTRVGIHSGSDNVGAWQMETFARLDAARKREEQVPCWYDPGDPAQAVLDRGERWELVGFMLVFPLVFGLAGGGIAWFGFHQWRQARRPMAEAAQLAGQRIIRADGGAGCALLVVAVIWNAISWVAIIGAWGKHDTPGFVICLVALFPLVGLGLLWAAVLFGLRRLRHGRPHLRLEVGSWNTGSRVRAAVVTRTRPQPGDHIAARLAVVRRVTTGSGKSRSTSERPLWTCDLAIDAERGADEGGSWAAPVELPLPSDLPPSDDEVTWRLEWQLVRPGPDLSVSFVLPVVAGSGGEVIDSQAIKTAADRASPLAVLTRAGVRIGEERGDVVIELPAWRNPGLHLAGLGACAIPVVGTLALWDGVGWWTALATVPLTLLCLRGAVRSCLWRSRLIIGAGRVAVAAGWWRIERREVTVSDIAEVVRTSNMSSGETHWFNMWLRTAEGERIAIARGVTGPVAARIAEMIEVVRR